jgi:hypothetical protein
MKTIIGILLILFTGLNLSSQIIGGQAYDKAFDMTSDNGNLYLVGFTGSYGNGNRDGFAVKYNCVTGAYIYNTLGKVDYDEFRSISKTNDGFIIAGFSFWREGNSIQAILTKLNSQLEFEWTKNFGNWHYQHAYKSYVLASGDYLIGGIDRSIGLYGPYLVKTNTSGETIWEFTYGDYMPSHIVDIYEKENENLVMLCSKGGFFNIGTNWHSSSSTDADVLFLEVDKDGTVVRDVQIVASRHDIPVKLIATANNKYYLLSHSQSYSEGKSFDICLSLLNSDFEIEWVKTYGGDDFEYAADMAIDEFGNIHIVGTSASVDNDHPVIMYLKTDANGELLDTKYLLPDDKGYGASIEVIDSSVYLLGTTSKNDNEDFVLFVNYELDNNTEFVEEISIYPNPVQDICNIYLNQSSLTNSEVDIEVYNSVGALIFKSQENIVSGDYSISLDVSDFAAGQYIVKLSNSVEGKTVKAMIVKI